MRKCSFKLFGGIRMMVDANHDSGKSKIYAIIPKTIVSTRLIEYCQGAWFRKGIAYIKFCRSIDGVRPLCRFYVASVEISAFHTIDIENKDFFIRSIAASTIRGMLNRKTFDYATPKTKEYERAMKKKRRSKCNGQKLKEA